MAVPKFISRLQKILFKPKHSKPSGFTLLELLVAMVVASIVVSGLLYLVTELLKTDRRESVLDQVQRDMQRAVNYVGDDVREAVFLYQDPSSVATQLTDLPTGAVPILAFWRPDPLNTGLPVCSTWASTTTTFRQCEVLRVRQSAYSLVVYLQKSRDTNTNWPGKSRIIRYELDKYSNLSTLTTTVGYSDPTETGSFSNWTRSGTTTEGTKSVLVDFVDDPTAPSTTTPSCTTLGAGYTIVPSTASTSSTSNTSFFGCIRSSDPEAGTSGSGNQDAYLYLRGNTDGAGGSLGPIGRDSSLPTLETRVLMRGVIDKNPVN
jgi:prepilin-type N-terminal cleavage/methylation domain-containing protein